MFVFSVHLSLDGIGDEYPSIISSLDRWWMYPLCLILPKLSSTILDCPLVSNYSPVGEVSYHTLQWQSTRLNMHVYRWERTSGVSVHPELEDILPRPAPSHVYSTQQLGSVIWCTGSARESHQLPRTSYRRTPGYRRGRRMWFSGNVHFSIWRKISNLAVFIRKKNNSPFI